MCSAPNKIQSICWDCTWVVATITLEVLMWVRRGFCSPTPLRELMVPLSGICIPKCERFWWKLTKCDGKWWKLQKSTLLQCWEWWRGNNVKQCADGVDADKLGKILKSEVKGTYPETKTVLVRKLTGELFLCCFKVNTWGFYRGEGGCEVTKFYIRTSEIKSKGNKGILRNQR